MADNSDEPARAPAQDERSRFDRLAASVTSVSSRPAFFLCCIGVVILWLAEGVVRIVGGGFSSFLDGNYQLQINTTTTIVTFLMVALLQNAQQRFENAINAKVNAISDALADFMEVTAGGLAQEDGDELAGHAVELRRAVGAEGKVGA